MKNQVKPEVRHGRTISHGLIAENKIQWLNNLGRGEEASNKKTMVLPA